MSVATPAGPPGWSVIGRCPTKGSTTAPAVASTNRIGGATPASAAICMQS